MYLYEIAWHKYYIYGEFRRIFEDRDNSDGDIELSDTESENTKNVEEQTVLDEIL